MLKETTKQVLFFVLLFCFLMLIVCVIGWFNGLMGASAMAAIFSGMASLVIAAYIWKAKNENVLKIVKSGDATMREAIALSKASAITSASINYSGADDDLSADSDIVG